MTITFCGAAQTVTGSKHLITMDNGKKLLLDCGLFQGMGDKTEELNSSFGFEPADIDYVLLSHAHIDHCGLLPRLVNKGYKGNIYATPATVELATLLMDDSAGIQENDTRLANKRRTIQKLPLVKPLYNSEDAAKAAIHFVPVDYNIWLDIADDVACSFTEAGHIIGSAAVHLRIKEGGKITCLTFSGDVGTYKDMILKEPAKFAQADYLILESTYGDSLHQNFVPSTSIILDWIKKICVEQKGKLIMPAFSVGRTQEILYALNQLSLAGQLPNIEYLVDSPLSEEATAVMKKYVDDFNPAVQKILKVDNNPFDFAGLHFVHSVAESKALNYKREPCVIISSSGMADAGRVKHHINNHIENSKNGVLLTGYCEPHSLGGRLKNGDTEVRIFGQWRQVNAKIGQIRSMSAHGDYEDLLQFVACQNAGKVKQLFLVHGELEVQQHFKEKLANVGYAKVTIPALYETHKLE